jgi:hypothetical protein
MDVHYIQGDYWFSKSFPHSPFSDTFSFSNKIQLFSQDRVIEETKIVCVGPLNRSIELEKYR